MISEEFWTLLQIVNKFMFPVKFLNHKTKALPKTHLKIKGRYIFGIQLQKRDSKKFNERSFLVVINH